MKKLINASLVMLLSLSFSACTTTPKQVVYKPKNVALPVIEQVDISVYKKCVAIVSGKRIELTPCIGGDDVVKLKAYTNKLRYQIDYYREVVSSN